MPTATFYRLPKEKRTRLIAACWAELTQARFTDISINRIISAAHIPRGSFYQYFTDKEDMVRYLLGELQEHFVSALRSGLIEGQGDLLTLPETMFGEFFQWTVSADPMLTRLIQILRLNHGLDFQTFLSDSPGLLPDRLWEVVDPDHLKQPTRDYANHVFFLTMAALAFSAAETLRNPAQRDQQRDNLRLRVEMIRSGCAAGARQHMEVTV